MPETNLLEKQIGVKFDKPDLLTEAITHRSYLNEHPNFRLDHNERLEFLGDAVLELAVTEYLYKNFPNPEGELTNWRASLVNGDALAEVGHDLGIENFILMSRGEAKDKILKRGNIFWPTPSKRLSAQFIWNTDCRRRANLSISMSSAVWKIF